MVNISGWENEFEEIFADTLTPLLIITWLKIMLRLKVEKKSVTDLVASPKRNQEEERKEKMTIRNSMQQSEEYFCYVRMFPINRHVFKLWKFIFDLPH